MAFSERLYVHGEIATGPVLFGFLLDFCLFGVLSIQTYMFYLSHPKDRPTVKAIVYGVFLVVVAQTTLAWHDFYALFCTHQGRQFTSEQNPYRKDLHLFYYTWFTIPASGAIVALVTQCVHAFRIHRLTDNVLVPAIIVFLATFQLVIGLWGAVEMYRISYPRRAHLQNEQVSFASDLGLALARNLLWAPVNALCSLIIMFHLIYFITRNTRNKCLTNGLQWRVTRLLGLMITSGLSTALASLAYALTAAYTTSTYMIFGLTLGKAYAFSVIVIVSCSRIIFVGGRFIPHGDTFTFPADVAKSEAPRECFPEGTSTLT